MTPRPFDILIVDDNSDFVQAIETVLNEQTALKCVATAKHCAHLKLLLQTHRPDLVLLDIRMPRANGIEGLKLIKREFPNIKVMMLTQFGTPDEYKQCQALQVDGFWLKSEPLERLPIKCLEMLVYGEVPISTKVWEENAPKPALQNPLTPKENEVLREFYRDSNRTCHEIATVLKMSKSTLDTHKAHIYRTIKAANIADAITIARVNQWFD
jgi:DNA-binding NarL/FixJ family response regulator